MERKIYNFILNFENILNVKAKESNLINKKKVNESLFIKTKTKLWRIYGQRKHNEKV